MMRRLAVRFAVVVAASCVIGLGSNVTAYQAEGDLGVYVSGFGLERGSGDVLPALWFCGEGQLPSWRCPAEVEPTIRAAHRPVKLPQWQRLSLSHMVWMAMYVDADRDWSQCLAYWTDTMNVTCADGFEVKV